MDDRTEVDRARERILVARTALHDVLVREAEAVDVTVEGGWRLLAGLVHLAGVAFDDLQAEIGVSWETYRLWREEDRQPREMVRRAMHPILVELMKDVRPKDATSVSGAERLF